MWGGRSWVQNKTFALKLLQTSLKVPYKKKPHQWVKFFLFGNVALCEVPALQDLTWSNDPGKLRASDVHMLLRGRAFVNFVHLGCHY